MCPELILWDWNGTLLDDVDLCVDALNRLLAGFGYPQRYDHERYRAIFGFPIEEYYVRAGFDFTKHSFAELAEKYMEDYVPASAACPLADGAIDALEAFKAAGLRQVIIQYTPLPTGAVIRYTLRQYRIILSADTASEARQLLSQKRR